jgi:hypothetical protein
MSESTVETTEPTTDAVETTTTEPETPELGDAGKKAIAAERAAKRAAEKRAAELEARVKEFEDASKSEAEKAAARAEAAEKALAEMTERALRLQVATEMGVPADLHEFLTGHDEESLRVQAEKLKAAMAPSNEPRSPRPDPSQGAKPANAGPSQLSRAELASMSPAQVNEALEQGRLNDVLAGKS